MGVMNSNDLKVKVDAANEKVEKRLTTISKICKKLNINFNDVVNYYHQYVSNVKEDWLSHKKSEEIVGNFVKYKELPEDRYSDEANEIYAYNDNVSQLIDNLCKLFDVERVAKNWQVKYDTELNKENAPKIQVLVDFLNEWGELATEWYHKNAQVLVDAKNEFHNIARQYLIDHNYSGRMPYEEQKAFNKEFNNFMVDTYNVYPRYRFSNVDDDDWVNSKTNVDSLTKELATIRFNETKKDEYYSYDNNFGYNATDGEYVLKAFNDDKLSKIIEAEKKAKYEDLCNRISAVVGEITDVSNLRISAKGNLDGIVEGTKGRAKVETIGAGGWNIQCFHYRVLVHKLK